MTSLDSEINQKFIDFMQEWYKKKHPKEDTTLVSAPIFKKPRSFEEYTFSELLDELRVRKEPYFRNLYKWLYDSFSEEFQAYQSRPKQATK